MAKPWLRLYREAVHRPKIGRLSMDDRGFWATCLMLSDDEGALPSIADIAWTLRMPEDTVRDVYMASLVRHDLVTRDVTRDVTEDVTTYRLHDWHEHQHASDGDPTAKERKQRQREREKAQKSAVTRDVTVTSQASHADVTRTDTDTDTDKERSIVAAQTRPAPKATRWKLTDEVPTDWIAEASEIRAKAKLTPVDPALEAARFVDFWAGKSGKDATKADWHATWRNWIRNSRGGAAPNGAARIPMGPA